MKKLLLILTLLAVGLSGCYVVPHRANDDGYRDHHDNRNHDKDRDGDRRDRDGNR